MSVLSVCENAVRLGHAANSHLSARTPSRPSVLAQQSEPRLSVVSLFSGIGGFDLGFERAGFDVAFQCEVSPFCLKILERHWPHVPRGTDIKELNGTDIPSADVWVGGFPCQDVSLARMGKRDGLRGKQSSLFFEFARLVDEHRPRVLLIENVPGLLSSHQGRDFGIILGTLADIGYSLGWRVLNSKNFGVPQSRQRVFIAGSYLDERGAAEILFESERSSGHTSSCRSHGATPISPFKRIIEHPGEQGAVTPSIAYCLYAESARHTGTDWSRNYVCYPSRGEVRRLTPRECEGVMAFPANWTVPEQIEWDEETYDTLRYHALGNAVTPPVAEWLAERTAALLISQDREQSESRKMAASGSVA